MTPRRLSSLLEGAGVVPLAPVLGDPEIRGVRIDSRRVREGDLFLALPGSALDGGDFVSDAVSRGARAVMSPRERPDRATVAWVRVQEPRGAAGRIAREWFGRPDESLILVGVTGTNGKTTTTFLLESIATAAGRRTGRIGTVGVSFAGREIPSDRTTPESVDFFETLATMRDARVEVVAAEVSSHALVLGRVEGARFAAAAFLNLGRDHLDFHGTTEAYFGAKAALFERLGEADHAILPADDPAGAAMGRRTRARTSTFGRDRSADVRITREASSLDGSTAVLETRRGPIEVRTALVGRYNLDNAAAAAACALALGWAPDAVARGIAALERVPGRLEAVQAGQPFAVLVDYAHTEQALARMLASVREVCAGRLIVAFGCGGDRDRGKRGGMGRAAARGADEIIVTSDNPRSEDPEAIAREVRAGVEEIPGGADRCRVIVDRAEAIASAIGAARPGDAVIVAGKGHETAQTARGRSIPFDDRLVARAALAAAGFPGASRADA